jgi:hypothetical protein
MAGLFMTPCKLGPSRAAVPCGARRLAFQTVSETLEAQDADHDFEHYYSAKHWCTHVFAGTNSGHERRAVLLSGGPGDLLHTTQCVINCSQLVVASPGCNAVGLCSWHQVPHYDTRLDTVVTLICKECIN